jgi:hypothetical protein
VAGRAGYVLRWCRAHGRACVRSPTATSTSRSSRPGRRSVRSRSTTPCRPEPSTSVTPPRTTTSARTHARLLHVHAVRVQRSADERLVLRRQRPLACGTSSTPRQPDRLPGRQHRRADGRLVQREINTRPTTSRPLHAHPGARRSGVHARRRQHPDHAGGEIFLALERGTVDAAEWVGPYDDEILGLTARRATTTDPPGRSPAPALGMYVNLDTYNGCRATSRRPSRSPARRQRQHALDVRGAQRRRAERLIAGGTQVRVFPHEVMEHFEKGDERTPRHQRAPPTPSTLASTTTTTPSEEISARGSGASTLTTTTPLIPRSTLHMYGSAGLRGGCVATVRARRSRAG